MEEMIEVIRRYGVRDERVLEAIRKVDRAEFVPEEYRQAAHEDRPLPIGYGQTISQPYTVARMCELLVHGSSFIAKKAKVLEIGTGSGWETAILAKLFNKVYSIELIADLAREAEFKIRNLKFENVFIKIGDGKEGWKEYAPYDGIIVAANADELPPALVEQLGKGGRLVLPVRGEMMRGTKLADGTMEWENFGGFSFVPLV